MKRLVLIGACALVLAACGGSGSATMSDAAQVKQVWLSFFSAKTPASKKPAMLQDGARFAATIANLANNPLASGLNAKVASVTLEGENKAKVVYSIYIGNTAALGNVVGYAYKQNGKWLVGYAGLCKLVGLAGSTPAACTS